MCGRYTITASPEELAAIFSAQPPSDPSPPRYNAAPTQRLPIIRNNYPNDGIVTPRQIELLRWGLVPNWSKGIDSIYNMINARAETLAEKPSFRESLQRRRCLVLTDGFYEWKKTSDGKIPMRITLTNNQPFAFAGLWDTWKAPDGQLLRSFTVITTAANEIMSPIHDRMPVILSREDEAHWLSNDAGMEIWHDLLKQYPSELMQTYPVSKRVNSPSIDDPSLIVAA